VFAVFFENSSIGAGYERRKKAAGRRNPLLGSRLEYLALEGGGGQYFTVSVLEYENSSSLVRKIIKKIIFLKKQKRPAMTPGRSVYQAL